MTETEQSLKLKSQYIDIDLKLRTLYLSITCYFVHF